MVTITVVIVAAVVLQLATIGSAWSALSRRRREVDRVARQRDNAVSQKVDAEQRQRQAENRVRRLEASAEISRRAEAKMAERIEALDNQELRFVRCPRGNVEQLAEQAPEYLEAASKPLSIAILASRQGGFESIGAAFDFASTLRYSGELVDCLLMDNDGRPVCILEPRVPDSAPTAFGHPRGESRWNALGEQIRKKGV